MTSILKVSEIQDPTNSNSALTVDSGGRVLQPVKPIFMAVADSTISLTTSYVELTSFSTALVNVGGHYNTSTGRFTVPVAGTYSFAVASIANTSSTVYRFRFYKNGSSLNEFELRVEPSGGAYGTNGEYCVYATLAVNDYISIYAKSDNGTDAYANAAYRYAYFRGQLVG